VGSCPRFCLSWVLSGLFGPNIGGRRRAQADDATTRFCRGARHESGLAFGSRGAPKSTIEPITLTSATRFYARSARQRAHLVDAVARVLARFIRGCAGARACRLAVWELPSWDTGVYELTFGSESTASRSVLVASLGI